MTITYKPVQPLTKKNIFELHFEYEHGDADLTTYNSITLLDYTEDQLVAYVGKVKEICTLIDHHRTSGVKFPKNFDELAKIDGKYIPVEQDQHYCHHTTNYYASMWLGITYWYDDKGEQFVVEISD